MNMNMGFKFAEIYILILIDIYYEYADIRNVFKRVFSRFQTSFD